MNHYAERALVARAINFPSTLEEADLRPEDFATSGCRRLWAAMLDARDSGKDWDPATLSAAVDHLTVSDILCPSDPAEEAQRFSSALANVAGWSAHVREQSRHQRIKQTIIEVVSSPTTADEKLAALRAAIERLEDSAPATSRDRTMADMVTEWIKSYDSRMNGDEWAASVPTGFSVIDNLFGELPVGVVTVLAARPSIGKSALARSIATRVSGSGRGVHVFSLEDTWRTFVDRLFAEVTHTNLHDIATPRSDAKRIGRAASDIAPLPIVLNDSAGISSAEMGMSVRRHKARNKTELVVVDYVNLIRESAESKFDEVSRAAEGLAALARRENVALLLCAQLNREIERREGPPRLSDLRDSGVLEQVASKVLFLDRKKLKPREMATVYVAKNKNGPTGDIGLWWDGPTASFREEEPVGWRNNE